MSPFPPKGMWMMERLTRNNEKGLKDTGAPLILWSVEPKFRVVCMKVVVCSIRSECVVLVVVKCGYHYHGI